MNIRPVFDCRRIAEAFNRTHVLFPSRRPVPFHCDHGLSRTRPFSRRSLVRLLSRRNFASPRPLRPSPWGRRLRGNRTFPHGQVFVARTTNTGFPPTPPDGYGGLQTRARVITSSKRRIVETERGHCACVRYKRGKGLFQKYRPRCTRNGRLTVGENDQLNSARVISSQRPQRFSPLDRRRLIVGIILPRSTVRPTRGSWARSTAPRDKHGEYHDSLR